MVTIISYSGDTSTVNVMRWLQAYKVPTLRISFSAFLNQKTPVSINLSSNSMSVLVDGQRLDEHSTIWLRKLDGFDRADKASQLSKEIGEIFSHIKSEYTVFRESFMYVLRKASWLCAPQAKDLNKIDVLKVAQECGLQIPPTLLTNSRQILSDFLTENPKSITKCITSSQYVNIDGTTNYLLATSVFKAEHLEGTPSHFSPSIVQKCIEKEVELRIFYLDGKFFSAAVFSQKQEHTSLDFRIFMPNKRACRIVPYRLPNDVAQKLTKLMQSLGLNTGSIDMIYTKSKEYVFLEVNPAGQYKWLSNLCVYSIDKHIADYLKQKHDENEIARAAQG